METTNTQRRATCPACFAQQAVRGNTMVAHGYKRPQHWHANVGNCAGVNRPHFGTEAGRAFTADIAASLRKQAAEGRAKAADWTTLRVWGRKRIAIGVYSNVEIDNPTDLQRRDEARRLEWEAKQMDATAEEFEARVAAWQPAEPVEVKVAKATGPLVHFRGGYYRGKACASSAMGAQKGFTTADPAGVTCAKCLAFLAKKEQA